MSHWIGIDQGKYGAIVLIDDTPKILAAIPTPLNDDGDIDALEIARTLKWMLTEFPDAKVWAEKVHAFHGSAPKSAFTFGGNYKTMLTVFDLMGIDYNLVPPKVWQKVAWENVSDKTPKETSFKAACQIFPDFKFFKTKDGIFDSALIAYYGRQYEST